MVAGNQRESNVVDPYVHLAVVRYRADGSLDPTFSGDGKLTVADFGDYSTANAVAIQADGKIVVAGGTALVRFNADGSFDPGFSDDGKVSSDLDAQAMAIQADGKIVLAGGYGFRLARYRADGSLDPAFSGDGTVNTDLPGLVYARSVALQDDGRIVAAGGIATSAGGTGLRDGALPHRRRARHGIRDRRHADHGRTRRQRLRGRRRGPAQRQDPGRGTIGPDRLESRRSSAGSRSSASAPTVRPTPPSGSAARSPARSASPVTPPPIALQSDGKIVLVGIGTTFESGSSMLSARYHGDAPAANVAPTARSAFSCSGLTCYLDASHVERPRRPGRRLPLGLRRRHQRDRLLRPQGFRAVGRLQRDAHGHRRPRRHRHASADAHAAAAHRLAGGFPIAQLSWNGTPGTTYGVYRGGKRVGLISGNTFTDRPPFSASGAYSFTVCEAFGPYCSATETVRTPHSHAQERSAPA